MSDKIDDTMYALMSKFNWTPKQIEDIPIPVVFGIVEKINEENKENQRQQRVAERKAKRMRGR